MGPPARLGGRRAWTMPPTAHEHKCPLSSRRRFPYTPRVPQFTTAHEAHSVATWATDLAARSIRPPLTQLPAIRRSHGGVWPATS